MSEKKKIIALIGSTRGKKTTSESIVNYLIDLTDKEEVEIIKYRAYQIFDKPDQIDEFMIKLKDSTMLLLCSPLYIDALPYPLLNLLENITKHRDRGYWEGLEMMAIIHSGYPEEVQRETCLAICKCFAEQAGMKWLGGLGFGGTSIINGKSLKELSRFTKWLRMSLKETSTSIIRGEKISNKAIFLSHKNPIPIPVRLLTFLLNFMVKRKAQKDGIDLYAQPYSQ